MCYNNLVIDIFSEKVNRFMKKDIQSRAAQDDSWEQQLIVGRNPVIEALKADKLIDTVYVNPQATGSITLICKMAKEKGILVKQVNEIKLNNMAKGASHQGVIAVGACAEYVEAERLLEIAREKGEDPFIIICDEIEDPHNLGAIIRTAEAAGAHGLIIPKRRSATLNHTVFKSSAGAASWLPVARVANLAATVDMLKKNGVYITFRNAITKPGLDKYTNLNKDDSFCYWLESRTYELGSFWGGSSYKFLIYRYVAAGIFMYEIVRQRNK